MIFRTIICKHGPHMITIGSLISSPHSQEPAEWNVDQRWTFPRKPQRGGRVSKTCWYYASPKGCVTDAWAGIYKKPTSTPWLDVSLICVDTGQISLHQRKPRATKQLTIEIIWTKASIAAQSQPQQSQPSQWATFRTTQSPHSAKPPRQPAQNPMASPAPPSSSSIEMATSCSRMQPGNVLSAAPTP